MNRFSLVGLTLKLESLMFAFLGKLTQVIHLLEQYHLSPEEILALVNTAIGDIRSGKSALEIAADLYAKWKADQAAAAAAG